MMGVGEVTPYMDKICEVVFLSFPWGKVGCIIQRLLLI